MPAGHDAAVTHEVPVRNDYDTPLVVQAEQLVGDDEQAVHLGSQVSQFLETVLP